MHAVTIATRTSQLALWQANYVRAQLQNGQNGHALKVGLLELISEGDKTLDTPLAARGGKGLFLKELEQALLRGTADLAVHSMKDVPITLPDGLQIAAISWREDPRDVLVSNRFDALERLPRGAVLGTCSLRRQCQIRAQFPHLQLVNLRGNVTTRLAKLDRGELDAIVLAAAGLKRLQLEHRITEYLATEICLPAVAQGALGIECRSDDHAMLKLIKPLNHTESAIRVAAERAANERLGGGCHVPLAVYAELKNGKITVRALVGTTDGTKLLRSEKSGTSADAVEVGHQVAEDLLSQGAADILRDVYDD